MQGSTTTASTDDSPFGGVRLADGERESIARAFIDVVLPMGAAWTSLLGRETEVAIGAIGSGPVPRPAELEPDPTASLLDDVAADGAFVALGHLGGELGTVAVVIPTGLGLVAVDLMLGGSGRPTGDRTLSEIDLDLLRSAAGPTFVALRHLGPPELVDTPAPFVDDIEEPELVARLAGGLTVEIEVTSGDETLPFTIVLGPSAARLLTGAASVSTTEAPAGHSERVIRSVLSDVPLEAVVTFPTVEVPSHRILGLDVGDILELVTTPDTPLPLSVDGLHLADVRPAIVAGDVACQVVRTTTGSTAPFEPTNSADAHGADRHIHQGGLS